MKIYNTCERTIFAHAPDRIGAAMYATMFEL
jgi:hypothetical protein